MSEILGVEEDFNEQNLSELVSATQAIKYDPDDVDYMAENEAALSNLKNAQATAIGGGIDPSLMQYMPTKKKPTVKWTADHPKIGRNDPCPCGSGKKFKNCCMGNGDYD